MNNTNLEIRMMSMRKGVRLWEIASELGLSDSSFSRRMRKGFSEEQRKQIIGIIDKIASSRSDLNAEQ